MLDLTVAFLAFWVFTVRMEYPWQLATPAGLALGALCYSTRQTVVNLRRIHRPVIEESSPDETSA